MAIASNLGFPRIGPARELKKALEGFWAGAVSRDALLQAGAAIRQGNWRMQKEAGLGHIPSNDFSFYDHVLDTALMVGAVPARFAEQAGDPLDAAFALARGLPGAHALAMTKWFDTNYHYLVPEFEKGQAFRLSSTKPLDEFLEAKSIGIHTRPVLLGPVSFLMLGKGEGLPPLSLIDPLVGVYEELLAKLADAGADWVQMDEPMLSLDCTGASCSIYKRSYGRMAKAAPRLKILLASYFNGYEDNLVTATHMPVDAVHLDLVCAPGELDAALELVPEAMALSLGVVDGRNIWRTDLPRALATLRKAEKAAGNGRIIVAPSSSLLHVPVDLDREHAMDPDLRGWLAFAKQKVEEVAALAAALNGGEEAVRDLMEQSRMASLSRAGSAKTRNEEVQKRVAAVTAGMARRPKGHRARKALQQESLRLPPLPTTTIGSFPQTKELRRMRAAFRAGTVARGEYEDFVRGAIAEAVRFQEEAGLDVLVHGEFERNDMVEYFAEFLDGVALTQNGWVQSYGSRCVKPPIIYGDVRRTAPMTVEWARYAQSLSKKPVKGMLTGPVTIMQWSFERDDQPRAATCLQIALAVRDEVADLERAGIKIIQIDEPAFREGMPLRRSGWGTYLEWAARCFRIASGGAKDETQVHTHMCYADFNDIIEAVASLDADVISIESSRSQMVLLDAFHDFEYPNDIGPGVYDVHSPSIPPVAEMAALLKKALAVLAPQQVWVNPDCGLKTRRWEEVRPAIAAMVEAARSLRTEVQGG